MTKATRFTILATLAVCASPAFVWGEELTPNRPADPYNARKGYFFLRQLKLGELMKRSEFNNLYRAWDGGDAEKVKNVSPRMRRKLAYARYGFVAAPYPNNGLPMGLVYDRPTDGVHFNCLLCHGGAIRRTSNPGLPNQRLDLATLLEDLIALKMIQHDPPLEPPPRSIEASAKYSRSRGGTNAWIKEANLLEERDPELNPLCPPPKKEEECSLQRTEKKDFDTTPSPFWHSKKKTRLYHAGFISFGPRPPMLAVLYNQKLSAERVKALLPDFENVTKWLDSVRAPRYPGRINSMLAASGKVVFNRACSGCHGTYGKTGTFPNHGIPIGVVGTDPIDVNGKGSFIENYYKSWFNDFGKRDSLETLRQERYLAPPLDGVWASAPYLHNGSVPTLYHILHPGERPRVWRVTDYDGYDHRRVGLLVHEFNAVPESAVTTSEKRRYFDTSAYGLGNAGHPFADELTSEEKNAVLEYLKTL